MLIGTITKQGAWWAADVDAAGVHTQGKTKAAAEAMLLDAIRELVNRPDLELEASALGDGRVLIEASDPAALTALVLRYQRSASQLSLADVSERLGKKSRNAYARYEQGDSVPTVDKLIELLGVVAPGVVLAFVERPARPAK